MKLVFFIFEIKKLFLKVLANNYYEGGIKIEIRNYNTEQTK